MIALSAVLEIFCFQSFGTLLEGEVTANNFFVQRRFLCFPCSLTLASPPKLAAQAGMDAGQIFMILGSSDCGKREGSRADSRSMLVSAFPGTRRLC